MKRTKIIIDTDPGIDDAMAILSAFNWDEVEVIGMTTLFGNVPTAMATENALILRGLASRYDETLAALPVVEGSATSFTGDSKHRIADFVHGSDGMGDCRPPLSTDRAHPGTAADFIVEQVLGHPGEVVVLALAATTNIALALKKDPSIASKWAKVVVLGGAFRVGGNVTPAAEANVFGDPEAANYLLQHGQNIQLVGLDVTHPCVITGDQLSALDGQGKFGSFLSSISKFYLQYHRDTYSRDEVFVHDSTAMIACVKPDLFTWVTGPVVVCTEGPLRGKTLVDDCNKTWFSDNEWLHRPKVQVAVDVRNEEVSQLSLRLMGM